MSRSHDAEGRFGGLAEPSFSTHLGRIAFKFATGFWYCRTIGAAPFLQRLLKRVSLDLFLPACNDVTHDSPKHVI